MIIQCPFCGAKYEAPPGRGFYVCPYCGTVISEGRTFENVYIFKPSVDKTTAFKKALNFRPFGSPEDLPQASPSGADLHFLPLYLYHITFQPLEELETYASALAMSNPPVKLPRNYVFPARWRAPFTSPIPPGLPGDRAPRSLLPRRGRPGAGFPLGGLRPEGATRLRPARQGRPALPGAGWGA